jgi:glutamate-1-semialdehyde 2,1-aminomutase
VLERDPPYARLEALAERLQEACSGFPVTVNRAGSLLTVFFTAEPVADYESARRSDLGAFGRFHAFLLEAGVYLPPSQFEGWFLSTAHDEEVGGRLEEALVRELDRIIAAR